MEGTAGCRCWSIVGYRAEIQDNGGLFRIGNGSHTRSFRNPIIRITVFRADIADLITRTHRVLIPIISPSCGDLPSVYIHVDQSDPGEAVRKYAIHISVHVQITIRADGKRSPCALHRVCVRTGDDESRIVSVRKIIAK